MAVSVGILDEDLARGFAMPGEVDDLWLHVEQRLAQIDGADGRSLMKVKAISVVRELKLLLDLSYLRTKAQVSGVRGIGGKKQNSDLLLHVGFRSGLSSNPVQARTLVSYDTE